MSYPFAACLAGYLAERGFDRRYVTAFLAMAAGLAVVFAFGVAWLAFVVQPSRGFAGALAAGFYPFVLADLLKLLAAAGVMPGLWWLTRTRAR
jgi:biotin transporter BioY